MRTIGFIPLLLCGALCALPAAAQTPDIGVAASVVNKVDGSLGPQTRTLAIGDKVFTNEVIRTGSDSKGQLLFRDETSLAIGPDSEVTLDKFVYNPNGGSLTLNATKGVFRFISGSLPKQSYEIKTPSATVGVRGTIAYFAVLPDGTSLYYVLEGGLGLNTIFGPINADAGEIVVIRPGSKPEVGKLKSWQKALFASLLDPDKKNSIVPDVPGMPERGNELRNLLRNQQQQEIICYGFSINNYCYD